MRIHGFTSHLSWVHPLPDNVHAVENAPRPKNITELKAYMGLLTYYGRFLPNLSTVLSPLYRLLRKDVRWMWSAREKAAFKASKQLLTSAKVLVHYNPELELVVAGDASSYGLGAILSHKMPMGKERPIAFASKSLTVAERNYSQLGKEALACIFAVKRFHSFIHGRHFMLQPTTNRYSLCWEKGKLLPHKQRQECNGGH